MTFVFEGTVESITTRNDKTIRVNIGSQEINNDNAARLFSFRNSYCKILLSDENISQLEKDLVSAHKTAAPNGKSKAQRLRAVLFVEYEQSGMQIPFEDYYDTEMEKIIISRKERLS